MTPAEVNAKVDAGFLAFVHCNHGNGMEPFPCSVQASKISVVIYCLCLRTKLEAEVWWVTTQEAAQRYGWHIRSDPATESVPGLVHSVDALVRGPRGTH